MITVDISFFKKLFYKILNLGTDALKIASGQMIEEAFANTLLQNNLSQFLDKIRNDGYVINAQTPIINIQYYAYYKTAAMLILGYTANIPQNSSLSEIIKMRDNFETLALKDVNKIVQQAPIAGFALAPNRESPLP